MEIVTWNLNGLDEQAVAHRAEMAAYEILLGAQPERLLTRAPRPLPDIILLQEVTARNWTFLKPHFVAAGVQWFPITPPEREYFELTAWSPKGTKLTAEVSDLPETLYGRKLVSVELQFPEFRLKVYNAHFDSGPEARVSKIRVAQGRAVCGLLGSEPAVFGGDTNLRDEEWSQIVDSANGVLDAWEAGGAPESARYTWQYKSRRARFDRVWLSDMFRVEDFGVIGKISGALPPSDHLGLRVKIATK